MDSVAPALQTPLRRLASGELPPNVAVMHLCMAANGPDEIDGALSAALRTLDGAADRRARLLEARRIFDEDPWAFDLVKQTLAGFDHQAVGSPEVMLARTAAAYDRAATLSPEASVALYSLGDPARLQAATDEVVAWLGVQRLLGPDRLVVEIGCGIGRFLRALAPEVDAVVGLDVSGVMCGEARARTAGLDNVVVLQTPGRDLSMIDDASVDLVLAVDSFPYLVAAGLAEAHMAESARVLAPGGDLVVFNWSYAEDAAEQAAAFARLSQTAGLRPQYVGERTLTTWDGCVFTAAKA